MNASIPATPIPSATLVLLRDGPGGLEVLMMVRHRDSGFAAGALVFPGGRIDDADHELASRRAPDLPAAPARLTAIRETWEECGVLLARRAQSSGLLGRAEVAALPPGANVLALPEIEPAVDALVPFAHWITPAIRPKRFDALFFLAPFSGDQQPRHDGREATAVRWVRPADAVAECDRGAVKLVFVTRMNLLKLARARDVAGALDMARRQTVVTVTPCLVQTDRGRFMRIPAEADYGVTDVPIEQVQAG
jgi:8-oxo-dGTP pyrophosphatase MutT (NUDIX family)